MIDAATVAKAFAYGFGLFYGVQKFFDTIEGKLNDETKTEIADWILGFGSPRKSQGLTTSFLAAFDRVFGLRCLSMHFFLRSVIATLIFLIVAYLVDPDTRTAPWSKEDLLSLVPVLLGSIVIDFISLTLSRKLYGALERRLSPVLQIIITLLVPALSSGMVICYYILLVEVTTSREDPWGGGWDVLEWAIVFRPAIFASLIASIWLWLTVAAGCILGSALRLPIRFPLLSRRFDVAKKPLQCLGMVAGVIVALCYWGSVLSMKVASE